MVISNNQVPNSVEKFTNKSTNIKDPVHFFFMERYEKAYKDQFNEFVKCVIKKTIPNKHNWTDIFRTSWIRRNCKYKRNEYSEKFKHPKII